MTTSCVGVMTYLPDVDGTWRELARVVRPGGLVVLTQQDLAAAPYLPEGSGGTPEIACYYLTARVD